MNIDIHYTFWVPSTSFIPVQLARTTVLDISSERAARITWDSCGQLIQTPLKVAYQSHKKASSSATPTCLSSYGPMDPRARPTPLERETPVQIPIIPYDMYLKIDNEPWQDTFTDTKAEKLVKNGNIKVTEISITEISTWTSILLLSFTHRACVTKLLSKIAFPNKAILSKVFGADLLKKCVLSCYAYRTSFTTSINSWQNSSHSDIQLWNIACIVRDPATNNNTERD